MTKSSQKTVLVLRHGCSWDHLHPKINKAIIGLVDFAESLGI